MTHRIMLVVTMFVLCGCQSAQPVTFSASRWHKDDPRHAWVVECIGSERSGNHKVRFEVVDPETRKRLAKREPGEDLTMEDLAGMRCASVDTPE